ncbi:MAG: molybdopterin guanine dinucleotide-containing S/N-oxide reductase [Alphaproteobacteria bacterium]|nr:molybdopterin guanine dinucleotide-containing S/N-oxide reductase [Alphaproteobacteria bacterium]
MAVRYTASHWGIYEVETNPGLPPKLRPFHRDPDPSPIGLYQLDPAVQRMRVARPAVRRGYLEHGPDADRSGRGREPFVEVDWPVALDLVAGELTRVKQAYGNAAIFGGSYGWASAGRFHHAQSQVHRFLNAFGGYVRHVDSYSLGAARVLMPHIVASMDELCATHTSWDVLAEHTQLFVAFGGLPLKNTQISSGGAGDHRVRDGLRGMARAGVRFVNVSPVADNIDVGSPQSVEWLAVRPNTDTALMLGLAYVLERDGLADAAFLARYCAGYPVFQRYLLGETDGQPKTPRWAEAICGVAAARIEALAQEMASRRTMINIAYALQRASHGEQPFWMLVTLAAMLGQIGLPGGGFGVGYGAMNMMGSPHPRFAGPTLPQGPNGVKDFIPVARIADMLLNPGAAFTYNGETHKYADIKLVYWAGGNPYHHHQDLNRLRQAWERPETIVVHEQYWTATAKHADIVLPATTALERNDINAATREGFLIAMQQAVEPHGEARNDYRIFADLSARLGTREIFTEGLSEAAWLRRLYDEGAERALTVGVEMPPFDAFWEAGFVEFSGQDESVVMLENFRRDPDYFRLRTPSGKIEIFSERIAGFGLADCPGYPVWLPPAEWRGADKAARYPLHLLSDQPARQLHSQLDHSPHSTALRIEGRAPVYLNPRDAAARGIAAGDIVEVFNDRGACLAGAVVSDDIAPGVARLSTGAWFDPGGGNSPERHGNPNVLTLDRGASSFSQGCAAQTCLVEVRSFGGTLPALEAHRPPQLLHAAE